MSIDNSAPPSPFTAAGRAHGQSQTDLNKRGLDGMGHPVPSQPANSQVNGRSAPHRSGGGRQQNIAQLAQSIGDMELSNQHEIHAYCDAVRKVLHYFAISTELAKGQLKAASRQLAKEQIDGRLTLAQQLELSRALVRLGRDLDGITKACVAGATSAVKAYRRFDTFMADLDKGGPAKFNRPGGRRGGFTLV